MSRGGGASYTGDLWANQDGVRLSMKAGFLCECSFSDAYKEPSILMQKEHQRWLSKACERAGRAKLILRLCERTGSLWAWPRQAARSQLSCYTRCVRNLLFYHSLLKGESPDSGRESMDQLLQVLLAVEERRVGRSERGLNPLRWLVQWRRLRVSKSENLVVVAKREEIWGALANARMFWWAFQP